MNPETITHAELERLRRIEALAQEFVALCAPVLNGDAHCNACVFVLDGGQCKFDALNDELEELNE